MRQHDFDECEDKSRDIKVCDCSKEQKALNFIGNEVE